MNYPQAAPMPTKSRPPFRPTEMSIPTASSSNEFWSEKPSIRLKGHKVAAPPIATHLSGECRLWVKGCLRDYVGTASVVPQIAADLLHRANRQSRANALNRCAIAEARLGRRGGNQGGDHR